MNKIYFLSIVIMFSSCLNKTTDAGKIPIIENKQKIVVPEFQKTLDSAGVKGSILIYDLSDDKYYSNNFRWAKNGKLPASTFKIANSIIAIETGVVKNDSTIIKWDGKERGMKAWEQDLMFREAFHYSCVPCYQEIARKIGVKQMREYLKKLNYNEMKFDSTSIDMFWLEGESRINQFKQIEFLKRLYKSELLISKLTESIIKRMIVIEENEDFKLSGKTGWSIRDDNNNGWFVGYVEVAKKPYFFATNVEPNHQFNMSLFPMIRKEVTYKALKQLEIM